MNTSLNFFNQLLKRTRSLSSIDPARDWLFLLISSTLALSGIIIWNVRAFDTVASGGTIGTPSTSTEPIFDQTSLETIHTIFQDRAAEEEKYTSGVYRYPDPSQGG